MGLIEKISNEKAGFHPVVVKDCWQVIKVNYSQQNELDKIDSLIRNGNNALALCLLTGRAVLLIQNSEKNAVSLKAITMVRGSSYVIPENVGYNIAMEKGCQLFAVESPYNRTENVRKIPLTNAELEVIKKM
ncbi:hypothetical protein GQ41_3074 [Arenibacter algicola]|uniref:Uncharacterized protein n=1 Tax=Arenibacter algicola TaxID=616991 RepID=A0ABY3ACE4_9FLAO|tara:strand:- start:209 stop:604 length:396 start_codon:yes stop_codon:yes gene_type:complete